MLPLPVQQWGLTRDGDLLARLCYPLLHASLLHALINVWCLLGCAMCFPLHIFDLVMAMVCAWCVPEVCLFADAATVGLSVAVYFLLGRITWLVRRRRRYLAFLSLYLLVSILLPASNGWAHLYGFVCGLIYGFVNTPLSWIKQSKPY